MGGTGGTSSDWAYFIISGTWEMPNRMWTIDRPGKRNSTQVSSGWVRQTLVRLKGQVVRCTILTVDGKEVELTFRGPDGVFTAVAHLRDEG